MHPPDRFRFRIENGDGCRIVYAEGELSIRSAEILRTALLDEIQGGSSTVLDISAVQSIDLCGLQLLCSAHRTGVRREAVLEVRGMSEPVRVTARAAGYSITCSVCGFRTGDICLWEDS